MTATVRSAIDTVPVKSADRTLDILELLAAEPPGLTISELSTRLGFAQSSTHGLVHTLLSRGYLTQNGRNRFQLGARLIQLGLSVGDRLELRSVAREPLERLVAATHDTALLAVPEGGELLYVDKVLSDASDIRTDPRVTSRRPLHCSSLGKALLAAVADTSILEVLGAAELNPVTPHTIADRRVLLADLASTRQRGYSLDEQEAVPGVFCVGAPVRDHTGRSIAAISLSTIKDFFNPEHTGPLVARAAVEISHAMGWSGDASTLFRAVPGSELLLFGRIQAGSERHR